MTDDIFSNEIEPAPYPPCPSVASSLIIVNCCLCLFGFSVIFILLYSFIHLYVTKVLMFYLTTFQLFCSFYRLLAWSLLGFWKTIEDLITLLTLRQNYSPASFHITIPLFVLLLGVRVLAE